MTKTFKDTFSEFVKSNKPALCFLLQVKEKQITDRDVEIACRYLVHLEAQQKFDQTGKLSKDLFNDIKSIPAEKRNIATLLKALDWNDIGNTLYRPLMKTYLDSKNRTFSLPIYNALKRRRIDRYRKEFNSLAGSMNDLAIQIRDLTQILVSENIIGKDIPRSQISARVKEIQSTIQKCHFRAKAGAAWAIKSDISALKIESALTKVYGVRMKKLARNLQGLDAFLNSQGVKANISGSLNKGTDKLMSEMKSVRKIEQERKITPIMRHQVEGYAP